MSMNNVGIPFASHVSPATSSPEGNGSTPIGTDHLQGNGAFFRSLANSAGR